MTTIAIHGAAGRMGLRLAALCHDDDQLQISAAIDAPSQAGLGQDVGVLAGIGPIGVFLRDHLETDVDVLIDFSIPSATLAIIEAAVQRRCRMVIGTTGLDDRAHQAIDHAAQHIAILQAPNMSLGINLLFALAASTAKQLGDDYDIEITEVHHRFKTDAPSGTALGLAQSICDATGKDMNKSVVHGRHGENVPRQPGQIGMHALRSGDIVGRHTVSFGTLGEELQLNHIATTRDVFVRGALQAAKWLADKPPRRYRIADVLGL